MMINFSNVIKSNEKYTVYCDGAISGQNNTDNDDRKAGIGIAFTEDNKLYEDTIIPIKGGKELTSNITELLAFLFTVVRVIEDKSDIILNVVSDSQYVVKGYNEWSYGWVKNNWVTSSGKEVVNSDLWKAAVLLKRVVMMKNIQLNVHWVRGHDEDKMNNKVDEMAVKGKEYNKDDCFSVDEIFGDLKEIIEGMINNG